MITTLAGVKLHPGCKRLLLLSHKTISEPYRRILLTKRRWPSEPKRLRDKAHLKFVALQPCLICGRQPSDPHHLRFAQPRAIGLKVSDEFTVPLCRGHHRQLHQAGNEEAWWAARNIGVLTIATDLWAQTRPKSAPSNNSINKTNPIVPQ